MHPAYSVIFFTTATGAGYGLLALLGVSAGFGLIDAGFWFRFVSLGLALDPDLDRAALVGGASRPAGTRLARILAMAQLLAVARGRGGGRDLRSRRAVRHRLGAARQGRRLGCGNRLALGALRSGDRVHDRNDLRIAETHRAMVEPLHAAGLSDLRRDDRIDVVQRAAAGVRRTANGRYSSWRSCSRPSAGPGRS